MRLGGGIWHWYDFIFVGLAAVIIFPDRVLDWIGVRTGRALDWRHVVLVELLAIALMVAAMALLIPAYPRLQWWYPLLSIGMLAVVRGMMWCVTEFFGFHD